VSVINTATDSVATVAVGLDPYALALA